MISGELAERAAGLVQSRRAFVLATVVRARRPTSVRPGDAAIVTADGTIDGFIGGVCAEAAVRLHALRALETGEPLLLRLVPGEPSSETTGDPADGAVVERNPCLSGGELELFLEPRTPAPRLVIVGDAPIARAVEKLARAAGYEAPRSSAAEAAPAPGDAALIVASHGAGEEERLLAEALQTGIPYVALVASRTRGEAVRAALAVPAELRRQLHTPAGLDIGARTPAEIAVSILAELIREHRAQPGPREAAVARRAAVDGEAAVAERAPVAKSATDPICGMTVAIGASTVSLETRAGRVHFCGERCRDAYAHQHASELVAP
ncbi:MAG: XdhC family protein [Solirubrobacterales bacterium]|nr:XdhC family protein [Solirubrobacterales bacterium]